MSAFDWLTPPGMPETPQEAEAANEAQMRAAARAEKERARLFFDVFTNGRGPELLALLRDRTIEQPLLDVTGAIIQAGQVGMSPADWAYYREGQNSLVRYCEQQVAIARLPEQEEIENV